MAKRKIGELRTGIFVNESFFEDIELERWNWKVNYYTPIEG